MCNFGLRVSSKKCRLCVNARRNHINTYVVSINPIFWLTTPHFIPAQLQLTAKTRNVHVLLDIMNSWIVPNVNDFFKNNTVFFVLFCFALLALLLSRSVNCNVTLIIAVQSMTNCWAEENQLLIMGKCLCIPQWQFVLSSHRRRPRVCDGVRARSWRNRQRIQQPAPHF